MAEKKITMKNGELAPADVQADYETAKLFDKVRVGDLGVYYRSGLKTRFLAYTEMQRAFIRVQETRSRMCCGQANFNYFKLVFVCDGKELSDIMSENEKAMDEALAEIGAHGVATGYIKEENA